MPTKLAADPTVSPQAAEGFAKLSDKQREVLELLLDYKSDKEIARDLSLSIKTIEQRMAAARQKLGTADRNETARVYAALRDAAGDADGGFPLYREPPLSAAPGFGQQEPGNAPGTTFTLHDAAFYSPAPWEVEPARHILPEVFHGRSATAVRLATIAAFAIALLMMALLAIGIGQGLTALFG